MDLDGGGSQLIASLYGGGAFPPGVRGLWWTTRACGGGQCRK